VLVHDWQAVYFIIGKAFLLFYYSSLFSLWRISVFCAFILQLNGDCSTSRVTLSVAFISYVVSPAAICCCAGRSPLFGVSGGYSLSACLFKLVGELCTALCSLRSSEDATGSLSVSSHWFLGFFMSLQLIWFLIFHTLFILAVAIYPRDRRTVAFS
jgi:hypothetical protein